ncbi:MAG: transporter domain containing protein [Parcubacteria group bacterium]|nr:transporter domain containing protein [Parcubacteria group bacterium]
MEVSTESAAIKVVDLKKAYKGKGKGDPSVDALKGINLTIEKGEFFALLGPNGAGKTTLISILSSLIVKTSGEAYISGLSLDKNADEAKAHIGLVPQEFNFNIFETPLDIVVSQAGYYGIPRKIAIERAEPVLTALGLWDKRNTQSMKLSGGMKRRLLIARALVHQPKVLLLDEPTAGVDVELRRGMWEFLRKLNEEGTTIVLTTHYLEEAEQLCRRVAIINKGEIIKEGSVKELLKQLNFVTLVLDTQEAIIPAQVALVRDMPVKVVDDTTLELTLKPGETVNDYIRQMSKIGVHILNIRNNGSRLEEIFVNLIEKN